MLCNLHDSVTSTRSIPIHQMTKSVNEGERLVPFRRSEAGCFIFK